MSKEILLNKLEKQFSYYELVDEMKETINYSKIVDFLDNEKDQKITDLEAKLAEKEKERHEEWKTGKEWKWEWQKVNQKLEKADQEKISFCIEQLEKVKEKAIKPKDYGWCDKYKDCWDIVMEIDNQIKQLKEMK